ncbi:uncharacterized protein LAESUDRAFT_663177 [Laetiporus sulphureus 93-53]|uniref:Uncharacterized protein n=1 Tax=Laetiporus sulphureus 93-53 TaxID=1314785 RepID=A0A165BWS1_9APHY|nr:uncharacterized protein LAESUDRAFT_663177 [Laetiporus sulphureus 93-53]KZT01794.1 hypothetical protein LAESUDRAFT_663177 [Laetiporus sulphureus 93-53]
MRLQATQARAAYRGRDHPRTWPLPPPAPVGLTRSHSIHYNLTSTVGLAEWNASLPSGGAIVHLGPDHRPFTVSILHQLRCLDIIRASLVDLYADDAPDATFGNAALAKHCMHYLRQMVLCRADTRLESVRAPKGKGLTVWEVTHECLDWTAVFDAAEENWRLYMSTTS